MGEGMSDLHERLAKLRVEADRQTDAKLETLSNQDRSALRSRSVLRVLTTSFVVAAVALATFEVQTALEERLGLAYQSKSPQSVQAQLDALSQTEASLRGLLRFVDMQEQKLREAEEVVNRLRSEEALLAPALATKRATIDAILELHAQQQQKSVWWERGWGFLAGIASSIAATLLMNWWSKRQVNRSPNVPGESERQ
jgi:hypothetical protein